MYGCVYKIECTVNHRVYIGQTCNYNMRVKNHKRSLSNNNHFNPYLQEDYNKFGSMCFIYDVLEKCSTREDLLLNETKWMNYYGGIESDAIYNVKDITHDETNYVKRKIVKLKPDSFRGHTHSSISKEKISKSLKDCYNKGLRKNICAGKYGKDNLFFGRHHTDETKKILSEKRSKMRKYTDEFIDNLINEFNNGISYNDLSNIYNIPVSSIKYLINNKEKYLLYGLNKKNIERCID